MPRKRTSSPTPNELVALMPEAGRKLLSSTGPEFIERVGTDVVKEVIFNVLCGKNLRASTEQLTRKRLGLLNAATVAMFLRGCSARKDFIRTLPLLAADGLRTRLDRESRWILQWLLGLTDKAFQNVLRDEATALRAYAEQLASTMQEVAQISEKEYGKLLGNMGLESGGASEIDWSFVIQLLGTIGAQTLAIRGSEKSTYGKLFERLILGAVLKMLEFELVSPPPNLIKTQNVFWLSSRSEKRESDATALCGPGRGVRFDIGFIGRGNPEISLDKVSRFERAIDLGHGEVFMATFIIVDRIGPGSRIERLAKNINGTVIQMSASYWPKLLAQQLTTQVGYKNRLASLSNGQLANYFKSQLDGMDLRPFIEGVVVKPESESENNVNS